MAQRELRGKITSHNRITGHGAVLPLAHEPSHTPQPGRVQQYELRGKIASHNRITGHGAELPLAHTDLTQCCF